MPIRPFLKGEKFDQETVRVLGVAFEQACIALRIGDCEDDIRQAIANIIIQLAKTGECNPDQLCEGALKHIRLPTALALPLDSARPKSMTQGAKRFKVGCSSPCQQNQRGVQHDHRICRSIRGTAQPAEGTRRQISERLAF